MVATLGKVVVGHRPAPDGHRAPAKTGRPDPGPRGGEGRPGPRSRANAGRGRRAHGAAQQGCGLIEVTKQRPPGGRPCLLPAPGLRTNQRPLLQEALAGAPPLDRRADGRQLLLEPLIAAVEVIDPQHLGFALAARPASTRLIEARRSVAMTLAPVIPSTRGRSPSGRGCRRRRPCASARARACSGSRRSFPRGSCRRAPRQSIAMNCACMSVAKPGNGPLTAPAA